MEGSSDADAASFARPAPADSNFMASLARAATLRVLDLQKQRTTIEERIVSNTQKDTESDSDGDSENEDDSADKSIEVV